jgi:hypothetical protein
MLRHKNVGAWLSLVERPVRDRKVAGSNPVAPTKFLRQHAEFSLLDHSVSLGASLASNPRKNADHAEMSDR